MNPKKFIYIANNCQNIGQYFRVLIKNETKINRLYGEVTDKAYFLAKKKAGYEIQPFIIILIF